MYCGDTSIYIRLNAVLALAFALCGGAGNAGAAPVAISPRDAEPAAGRLTLSLDDAPLLQILHLLGATGPARFRLGAPPDAVVSVRWQDEDPLASVDELVSRASLRLQRDGSEYFVLPLATNPGTPAPAGMWAQWMQAAPPPRNATIGPDATLKVKLAGNISNPDIKDADGGKAMTVAQRTALAREAALWRPLVPAIDAGRRPGIAVQTLPAPSGSLATWLRCQVPLSVVPRGIRLILESTRPLDLLVNGAPVARGWSGLRSFDVEPVLHNGTNVLAVRWSGASAGTSPGATLSAPVLRYEWVFDGGGPGGGLPGETSRSRD